MILDEAALRVLIEDVVRRVVREEMQRQPDRSEYVSVAEAARIADVAPGTIRMWITEGKLSRRHAGRELRILRQELGMLMTSPPSTSAEPTPEELAERDDLRSRRGSRHRHG